jgi:hypothetical protein
VARRRRLIAVTAVGMVASLAIGFTASDAAPPPAGVHKSRGLRVLRCPAEPSYFTPTVEQAIRAIRRLRIVGRTVIAQGRVKLTAENSPVMAAIFLGDPTIPGAAAYRKLIKAKCGTHPLGVSWYVAVSFPTLLAGSGDTPYIVTLTRHGWRVLAQE